MTKEETKKLWFHTIIFLVGTFLLVGMGCFFEKRRSMVGEIIILLIGGLFWIDYSLFMLRWFRKKGWIEKNKSFWHYFFCSSRYSLAGSWTRVLFIGILALVFTIIYLACSLINLF